MKTPECKYRPSSLPILAKCPKFEGRPSQYTDEGTERHTLLAEFMKGNENAFDSLSDEAKENLEWAVEQIKLKAPLADHALLIEQLIEGVLPNGMKIWGTPDFQCGPVILDLKSRFRDYRPQMAAYAYCLMEREGYEKMETICLFSSHQTARSYSWTLQTAWELIEGIIEKAESVWAAPDPCAYCGWCAKATTCEALIAQVNIALDANPEWALKQWHSSQMETAAELGQALKIARTLADWAESVEHHCKEKAFKEGIIPEGYKPFTRRGNRFCESLPAAFSLCNLPQDDFLKCCKLSLTQLEAAYASFHGLGKTAAKNDINKRLAPIIQHKPDVRALVEEKAAKQTPNPKPE